MKGGFYMLRTIYWIFIFITYLLLTIPFSIIYRFKGKQGKDIQEDYLLKVTTIWAKHMIKHTGTTVTVTGEEHIPDGPVLVVSNHQGYFDIPSLIGYVPKLKGFISKTEVEHFPIIASWMKRLNCLYLDRGNLRQNMQVIKDGVNLLKSGHSLLIFPEGTRSKGDQMGSFKKGSLKLATKSGVPIVPVTLDGTYKVLEERKRITKSHINVTIHPPIDTANYDKDVHGDLADYLHGIIETPLK